jgi:hypothetical protein
MTIDLGKLKDYWEVLSIILTLIIALTYFVIENKQVPSAADALIPQVMIIDEFMKK